MNDDQFKTMKIPFSKLTRDEKLATAFYPANASPEDRKACRETLRREGWKGEGKALLKDHERGGVSPLDGRMKPAQRRK